MRARRWAVAGLAAAVCVAAAGLATHAFDAAEVEWAGLALGIAGVAGIAWGAMRWSAGRSARLNVSSERWSGDLAELARRRGLGFEIPPPYEHPVVGRIVQVGRVQGELEGLRVTIAVSSGDSETSPDETVLTATAPGTERADPGFLERVFGGGFSPPARPLAAALSGGGRRVRRLPGGAQLTLPGIVTDPDALSAWLDALVALARAHARKGG